MLAKLMMEDPELLDCLCKWLSDRYGKYFSQQQVREALLSVARRQVMLSVFNSNKR